MKECLRHIELYSTNDFEQNRTLFPELAIVTDRHSICSQAEASAFGQDRYNVKLPKLLVSSKEVALILQQG